MEASLWVIGAAVRAAVEAEHSSSRLERMAGTAAPHSFVVHIASAGAATVTHCSGRVCAVTIQLWFVQMATEPWHGDSFLACTACLGWPLRLASSQEWPALPQVLLTGCDLPAPLVIRQE
jgi:hypothetical protein